MITITNEDNMELMARYKDNHFDLAIVDPPYGIDGNSHRNNLSRGKLVRSKKYHNALWDQDIPTELYFKELKRVSKKQIIWGANYFKEICGTTFNPPRRDFYKDFINDNPTGWMIWDKVNSTTNFNDCELAFVGHEYKTEIIYFMWSGMMQGLTIGREGSVMNGKKELNEIRIHPTQKPVKIYKWMLKIYADNGYLILDTHRGSASLDIACWDLGFDLVTSEIDKTYFDDGNKRLKEHQSQYRMF